MDDNECCCPRPGSQAGTQRRPRMGVSSLSRPPPPFSRPLPLSSPIAPRPSSPPRLPRTVPGLSRGPRTPQSATAALNRTLSPGSADRTLTYEGLTNSLDANTSVVRQPETTKLEETLEELHKLEFVERQTVEEDLREYQKNRRKLVFDVVSLKMSKAKKSVKKAVSRLGM